MAAQGLALQVGVAPACQALGVSRATFYRRQRSTPGHQQPRRTPARALCASERERVLDVLVSARFVDHSPGEVMATLLDEGQYLCSERTMYRVLAANQSGTRASQSTRASAIHQARARGHGTEPDLVVGRDQTAGPEEVDVLLPLRVARHLQPLRGGLDGGRP